MNDKLPSSLLKAELPFTKMQGLGNDFVLLEGRILLGLEGGEALLENWNDLCPELARILCDRRFGVGADGLLLCLDLKEPRQALLARKIYGDSFKDADIAWSYTNSDGSFSATCGNGLRCITKFALDRGLCKNVLTILTFAGVIEAEFKSDDEISINFGKPALNASSIPYLGRAADQTAINIELVIEHSLGKTSMLATMVNVGNPHCVVFVEDAPTKELIEEYVPLPLPADYPEKFFPPKLAHLAQAIQVDRRFPEGTNVEFVWVNEQRELETLVYERGCGATLACGSAAAATAVAASLVGKTGRSSTVNLAGGRLQLNWRNDDQITLSGPARQSFTGSLVLQNLFESRQAPIKREVSLA